MERAAFQPSSRHAGVSWLLPLLLATTAMVLHFFPYGYNNQRLAQLTLIALAVLYIWCRPQAAMAWPAMRCGALAWLLFFLAGAASATLAYAPQYAWLEVACVFLLFVIGMAVGRDMAYDYERKLRCVLLICAMGCAAYVLQAAIGYGIFFALGRLPHIGDLTQNFANYRFFNHAQTITLPLLVLWCCAVRGRAAKIAAFALSACWWALLFATGGRGTMLGILAAGTVALCVMRRGAWRYCTALLLTAMAGYLINVALFVELPQAFGMEPVGLATSLVSRTMNDPTSMRNVMWLYCMELMLANPLTGIGPMQFAHAAQHLKIASHPHSWLFQFGVEWGIPALIFLCVAMAAAASRLVACARAARQVGTSEALIGTGLIVTGVAIGVDALVSGTFVMPVSQLLIALYIGCASGWMRTHTPVPASTPTRAGLLAWRGGLLLAAVAVVLGVAPDFDHVRGGAVKDMTVDISQTIYPRFWLDGGI